MNRRLVPNRELVESGGHFPVLLETADPALDRMALAIVDLVEPRFTSPEKADAALWLC
ncbi:hypothetical protein ABT187_46785 [Streptomyces sp. NPDC001817]|uniref:hypothetical protein n=1 Tax=Streptomyces sp. NPDC001817 TaxID=3154398 RepID=UPI0033266223